MIRNLGRRLYQTQLGSGNTKNHADDQSKRWSFNRDFGCGGKRHIVSQFFPPKGWK